MPDDMPGDVPDDAPHESPDDAPDAARGTLPLVRELLPAPHPLAACARLIGLPRVCFLDSSSDDRDLLGRYSFLMADPALVLRAHGSGRADGRVTVQRRDEAKETPWPDSAMHALDVARTLMAPHRRPAVAGLPPFPGGFAGYLGYEWARALERLPVPARDDLALPDVQLGLYDWTIAWDHAAGRAWIISTGLPHEGAEATEHARARLTMVRERLAGLGSAPPDERELAAYDAASAVGESTESSPPGESRQSRVTRGNRAPSCAVAGEGTTGLRSTIARDDYLLAVDRVREYAAAGDIFQANLSQRLEMPAPLAAFPLYRQLRRASPAPFAAYLHLGDAALLSASPERFVRASARGAVETRPIKGTRPRGATREADDRLAVDLVASAKDRAEHVMIVDLMRNDIGRVCETGSVRVPELFVHERHPTVHHLVSTVVGRLRETEDACSLLAATFPPGSVTGAPKLRAMEIIAELEPTARGPYCGAIGYLSVTGACDTSVVIRTIVFRDGRATFGAGGGIVIDSDAPDEWQETMDKARALITALTVDPPAGGRS